MTRSRAVRRVLRVPLLAIGLAALTAACSAGGDAQTREASIDAAALAARQDAMDSQLQQLVQQLAPKPSGVVSYDKYGFKMPMPAGVDVRVAGLTGGEATEQAGTLAATAGGATVLLLWTSKGLNSAEAVQGAYDVLRAATPGVGYVVSSSGNLAVDGESGNFGSFAALSPSNEVLGIGLIGGWACEDTGRTYALTVTGAEQVAVESSFQRLTGDFRCA